MTKFNKLDEKLIVELFELFSIGWKLARLSEKYNVCSRKLSKAFELGWPQYFIYDAKKEPLKDEIFQFLVDKKMSRYFFAMQVFKTNSIFTKMDAGYIMTPQKRIECTRFMQNYVPKSKPVPARDRKKPQSVRVQQEYAIKDISRTKFDFDCKAHRIAMTLSNVAFENAILQAADNEKVRISL